MLHYALVFIVALTISVLGFGTIARFSAGRPGGRRHDNRYLLPGDRAAWWPWVRRGSVPL